MHIIKVSLHVQHCKRCPFAGGMRKLLVIHDAVLASSNESPSMTVHYNEFAITSIGVRLSCQLVPDHCVSCARRVRIICICLAIKSDISAISVVDCGGVVLSELQHLYFLHGFTVWARFCYSCVRVC